MESTTAAVECLAGGINDTLLEWTLATPVLFSFIGAAPRTDWLAADIDKDTGGFIRTGTAVGPAEAGARARHSSSWKARVVGFLRWQ